MRTVFTTIQQCFPGSFARLADTGGPAADVTVDDVATLAQVLPTHGSVPAWIHCGDHRIHCAASPHDLVARHDVVVEGPLRGHVILVTGAANGLGLGIARGAYAAGACVLLADIDAGGLTEVAASFADQVRVHTALLNVTDEDGVAAAFDAALVRWGRIDGLVCCAGVAPSHPLVDFPLVQFRLANEINLTGSFLCAREFARIAIAQGHGGSMVFLSSKAGLEASLANTACNATRAGALHLSRGWALELGGAGIRSNGIAPGEACEGSKIRDAAPIGLTAPDRATKPEDIANAVVFLLSDAARCVTGQVLVVDGGPVFAR